MCRVLPSTPRGPCLTMASSTPRSSSASAALCGLVSPTAISHSSRLPTATVTCRSALLHLLGGVGRATPRTSAGSRGRAPSAGPWPRASQAAKCALRLGSSDRPVTVDQYSRAVRTASRSISSARICRSGALTACGRSTAGSRRAGRSRRTSPGSGTRRGSARSGCRRRGGQLGADEPAERVVADAGDQRACGCRAGRRPPRRWRRCRRGTCRTTRRARGRRRSAAGRCRRRCVRWRVRRTAAWSVKIGSRRLMVSDSDVRLCPSSLRSVNSLS